MSILVVLIPISVALASLALWACIASIRNGQYKDLESPKWRILFDDNNQPPRNDKHDHHQVR